jgi:hypothetical protein
MLGFLKSLVPSQRRGPRPAEEISLADQKLDGGILHLEGPKILVATEDQTVGGRMPDIHASEDLWLHVWSPRAMPSFMSVGGSLRLIIAQPRDAVIDTQLCVGGNLDIVDTAIGPPAGAEIGGFVSTWLEHVPHLVGSGTTDHRCRGYLLLGKGSLGRPSGHLVDEFPRLEVLTALGLRHRGASRLVVAEAFVPAYLDLLKRIPPRNHGNARRIASIDPSIRQVAPDPTWFDGRYGR